MFVIVIESEMRLKGCKIGDKRYMIYFMSIKVLFIRVLVLNNELVIL